MPSSMRSAARAGLLAWLLAAGAGGASALSLGQTDTFAGGSTLGWGTGPAHPSPPYVVAGGGPGGASDAYMVLTANGGPQEGSRLAAFVGPQWLGDYTAVGIDGLTFDLNNFGATDLNLRLLLDGPGGRVVSSQAVLVPAGSGWQPVAFSLLPGALTGPGATVLADVTAMRLFHSAGAVFPGPGVVAQLGIDNVTAVPEPAGAALMLAGLAGMFLHCRRPRRAAA